MGLKEGFIIIDVFVFPLLSLSLPLFLLAERCFKQKIVILDLGRGGRYIYITQKFSSFRNFVISAKLKVRHKIVEKCM